MITSSLSDMQATTTTTNIHILGYTFCFVCLLACLSLIHLDGLVLWFALWSLFTILLTSPSLSRLHIPSLSPGLYHIRQHHSTTHSLLIENLSCKDNAEPTQKFREASDKDALKRTSIQRYPRCQSSIFRPIGEINIVSQY